MSCPGCYAAREQVRFPSILQYRTDRYLSSLKPSFPQQVISEISAIRKPITAFRLHSSGEFYSQQYISHWATIATTFPHIPFYAFTKRLRDFDFTPLTSLSNVVIIDSLYNGKLNYDKLENLDPSRPICPATTVHARCGIDCTYCMDTITKNVMITGIQFVKH